VKVAFVVYPDFTALDLVGPYEVISRWPGVDVHFVSSATDPVQCDSGLTVLPTDTPSTLPDPDLIVVPGSGNPLPVLDDKILIDWLRTAAPHCAWTASVCTGSGLYAVAGLLEGKSTTTHWGFRDYLKALGVTVVPDRVVWEGTHVSGAGVSAGIDTALSLTERVHGRDVAEALQLIIEYDPEPPFDSGSLQKANPRIRRLARKIMLGDRPVRAAATFGREMVRARLRRARGPRVAP
jgi:transcriptional regulator GlxA family with amidase domain